LKVFLFYYKNLFVIILDFR